MLCRSVHNCNCVLPIFVVIGSICATEIFVNIVKFLFVCNDIDYHDLYIMFTFGISINFTIILVPLCSRVMQLAMTFISSFCLIWCWESFNQ